MKKVALLALLITSFTAFAQGQAPPPHLRLPLSHYTQVTHLKMDDVDWISPSKSIRENPSFPAHHQVLLMPDPIQLVCSGKRRPENIFTDN